MLQLESMEVDLPSDVNKVGESSSRAKGDDDDDDNTPLSKFFKAVREK